MTTAVPLGARAEPSAVRAVEAYLDHLAVERGLAVNTLVSYRRDLERYTGFLAGEGTARLSEVDEAGVARFLAALRTGDEDHRALSSSSAGRAVVAVRGLHRFAVREGWTAADPSREVRPPVPARRLPKAISVEQVEAPEHGPGRPKVRQGIVVSDKADKTIVVRIDIVKRHRRYGKIMRTSTRLHAHDESNDAGTGDTVRVIESRPLSATKRWRLVEVVERAR